jgi:hypothetical protein
MTPVFLSGMCVWIPFIRFSQNSPGFLDFTAQCPGVPINLVQDAKCPFFPINTFLTKHTNIFRPDLTAGNTRFKACAHGNVIKTWKFPTLEGFLYLSLFISTHCHIACGTWSMPCFWRHSTDFDTCAMCPVWIYGSSHVNYVLKL